MIDRKLQDLLNREIDGQTSPEESNRLRVILASSGEAREAFEGLQQMEREMSVLKAMEPPPSLKPAIMRSVEASAARPLRRTRRTSANAWKFGVTFCGGLVAGILVFIIFASPGQTPHISDSELTGTIAKQDFAPGLNLCQKLDINDSSVSGGVESRGGNGLCLVHLDLRTAPEATVKVRFDPAAVRIAAIRPSNQTRTGFFIREREIVFTGAITGPLDIVFSARNGGLPPARIDIEAGGRTIFSSSLKLQSIGS
jgi:hypothetical protein